MVTKTMTTFLVSAAEFSNIVSVLAVLLCFCAMILFITRNMMVLRVHGEDFVFPTPLHQVTPRIPQMNMMKVHIPFTFKLLETSKSSYSELQCCTSSQVRYGIHIYWGVNIRELHIFLWRPWSDLRDACLRRDFLQGYYQYLGPQLVKKSHSDQNFILKLENKLELGAPPRLCYPLVIILYRNDVSENIHPDETVALINVIHIKDSVCTLPTSILAQYLKQANGQLSCLKVSNHVVWEETHFYSNHEKANTSIIFHMASSNKNGRLVEKCDDTDILVLLLTSGIAPIEDSFKLQQLYLATGNPGGYEEGQIPLAVAEPVEGGPEPIGRTLMCPTNEDSTLWNSSGEQLCVVCQYFPLSRALLPCRHTCICASCFDKLDRCPMCRGPIKSYFCIRGEEYMPISSNSKPQDSHHSPLYNWLHHWDDRLTDFLGFQR